MLSVTRTVRNELRGHELTVQNLAKTVMEIYMWLQHMNIRRTGAEAQAQDLKDKVLARHCPNS